MKLMMCGELSGDLLRVGLYELIPQIDDGKRYSVRIDEVAARGGPVFRGDIGGAEMPQALIDTEDAETFC